MPRLRSAPFVALTSLLVALPARSGPVGVWAADGYGTVWAFAGDTLQSWEITTTTCVRGARYGRAAVPPPGASAAFLEGTATAWIIRPGGSSRRFVAHSPGTVSDVVFRPRRELPAPCRVPTPATPQGTFAVFERTMAEQYASFGVRGVDWAATERAARVRLGAVTTPAQLYQLLEGMIAPLEDRHTDLTAPDLDRRVRHHRASGGPLDPRLFDWFKATPPSRYLTGPLERWCQDWIQYGELAGSIGYLRVMREYGYTPSGRFEDDSVAVTAALDRIMPRAARLRGLVVDVRLNGGGADAISLLIASRLTARGYLAFRKHTRVDPVHADRYTPAQPVHVHPGPAAARFVGPVVLLTGPFTLSAGEVLTLALLGRRPAITRIGEATQGIFADELIRRLPNGWRFQLSTERYLTPEGRNYEGPGIPPDRQVPLFPESDRAAGRDGALEAALEVLANRAHEEPR